MDTITKDYWNDLLWSIISIAAGIFSFSIAGGQSKPAFIIVVGSVFALGGVVLLVKAHRRFYDFRRLITEGSKHAVWISVHNSGAKNSSATSLLIKVYFSETAPDASITFETAENNSLRKTMDSELRTKATLLKRKEGTNLIMIYFEGHTLLPSSHVRYL